MNITIRVDDELAEEIEKKRGDKSKADFYREILEHYLRSSEDGMDAHEKDKSKSESEDGTASPEKDAGKHEYILRLEDEVKYLRTKVDDLIRTLNQEQVLHLQTQKLLPAPETPAKLKPWWQFWKK